MDAYFSGLDFIATWLNRESIMNEACSECYNF